jgi:hypothetical protein
MADDRPTHLLAESADRYTLCGRKASEKTAYPQMLAKWLPAHQAGHAAAGKRPVEVCSDCYVAAAEIYVLS